MIDVIGVLATGKRGEFALNGSLPWKIKKELLHFKNTTMGTPVIMGSETFKSIGYKPLGGRLNIVLTRNPKSIKEFLSARNDVVFSTSIEEAINVAKESIKKEGWKNKIFIIGGKQIFYLSTPYINKWIISIINKKNIKADKYISLQDLLKQNNALWKIEKLENKQSFYVIHLAKIMDT